MTPPTADERLDPRLLEILACPEDKGPLLYFADESALYNPRLKRRYPIREGIPVMLIDEAISVDDDEDARLLAKAEADGIEPTFEADRRSGRFDTDFCRAGRVELPARAGQDPRDNAHGTTLTGRCHDR